MNKLRYIFIVLMTLFTFALHSQPKMKNTGKPFFHNFSAEEYNGHNRNFGIECDSIGRVYIANFEGLIIYDGVKWEMHHTPAISRITSLYKSKKGRIWFGGNNVLGYIEDCADSLSVHFAISDDDKDVKFGEITEIFEQKGELCFSTNRQTYKYTNKGYNLLSSDKEPKTLEMWKDAEILETISISNLGITAMATTGYGIILKDYDGNYTSLTSADGLCSNSITDIAYDDKGTLWGATENGVFLIHLSPVFSHYGESDGLTGQVTSILKNKEGLMVGTLQGLFILENDGHFTPAGNLSLACWQLLDAADGSIIIATAEGLYTYDGSIHQLSSRHTLCIAEEEDGSILSGEIDGIFRITRDGQSKQISTVPNVVKFVREKDGGLWAITLYRNTYYKAPKDLTFIKKTNNNISLLFEYIDKKGNSWHSDKSGLGITSEAMDERQEMWCTPLKKYNIQAMSEENGIAWIGGSFGLIRMDMNQMKKRDVFPLSTHFRYFHREGENITFQIAADKLDAIGDPQFSYRLHDNDNWSKWNTDQDYNFTNLAYGKYSLEARVKDSFGNIVTTSPINFEIPVPFYAKWYALVFYIAILGFIAYLIFRLRMRQIELEKQRLETIVSERTRELKDAQKLILRQERQATIGKLTSGLIDRILNPMNYINNFSHISIGLVKDMKVNIEDEEENMSKDVFEDSLDIVDMLRTNMEKIEQHGLATTRILKAMEELLNEHTGKVTTFDISIVCQQCIEMFNQYYKDDISKYGIEIDWQKPDSPMEVEAVADDISKTFMSMLSNSIYAVKKRADKKSSPDYHPQIRLTAKPGNENTNHTIVFYDNGIGIETTIAEKIFDPFFTTKQTGEAPGVGLYLCHRTIQDAGGEINVDSEKDEYAQFTVSIPTLNRQKTK